jgi:hypothetical protein
MLAFPEVFVLSIFSSALPFQCSPFSMASSITCYSCLCLFLYCRCFPFNFRRASSDCVCMCVCAHMRMCTRACKERPDRRTQSSNENNRGSHS